jgi:hypothetical protein
MRGFHTNNDEAGSRYKHRRRRLGGIHQRKMNRGVLRRTVTTSGSGIRDSVKGRENEKRAENPNKTAGRICRYLHTKAHEFNFIAEPGNSWPAPRRGWGFPHRSGVPGLFTGFQALIYLERRYIDSYMATALTSLSPRWTNETLQPLRAIGDPLADAAIAELFADGGVASMNALMASFVANEHLAPATLPLTVQRYLEESSVLPAWADPAIVKAGEDVFWRFGPRIILTLCCYSLPFCYLGRDGVPVLAMTNRLSSNSKRRIVETAQMVVDCLQAGGLTTGTGRGRLTVQKVRLMHAAIRRLAPSAPTYLPEFGIPVNQEDLAGTLMSFSWITLDGLEKLDIPLTEDDRQAYIHCWNVVGHLLGVHDDLLPANATEAKALSNAIAAHQFGPTQDGKDLTAALVDMMAHVLPGNIFDRVPALLIGHFLGKQWAGWLGVEDGVLAELAAAPLRLLGLQFGGVIEDSKVVGRLAEKVGQLLIDSILLVERGGNRPAFAIPAELKQQWGVNWTA